MKEAPPGRPSAITFAARTRTDGLPVALGAEAVAVGHQPLHGQAGQLAQAAEVLEGGGERAEAAGLEEGPQRRPRSGRRSGATRGGLAAGRAARGRRRRGRSYSATRVSMSDVGDAGRRQSTRSLTPQVLTETPKRSSASVLSPSVTATLRMLSPKRASFRIWTAAQPRPRGGTCPLLDRRRTTGLDDVADDGLARDAEPGLDVAELAVAVRGLVEVHEVEVDGPPTAAPRWPACAGAAAASAAASRPGDPHLGGRERVHPRDQADARCRSRVGLERAGGGSRPSRCSTGFQTTCDRDVRRARRGGRRSRCDWSATCSSVSGP